MFQILGWMCAFSSVAVIAAESCPGTCWKLSADGNSVEQVDFSDLDLLGSSSVELIVDGKPTSIPLANAWRLELTGNSEHVEPQSWPLLAFANGDVWPVARIKLDQEELSVWPDAHSGPLVVQLDALSSVYWAGPVEHGHVIPTSANVDDASTPLKATDVVHLLNHDELRGEVSALDAQQLQLTTSLGDLQIPIAQIQCLDFNPDLIAEPSHTHVRYLVQLANGARLSVDSMKFTDTDQIGLSLLSGQTWNCPKAWLHSIDFISPTTQPLTWLPLREVTQRSYFGEHLPTVFDGSQTFSPLQLDDRQFPHGLGTRSQSAVTWSLPLQARRLCVIAGLQNTDKPLSHVTVEVWGRIHNEAEFQRVSDAVKLTPKHPSVLLGPLDVSGMAELRLQTGFGRNADIGDCVNWCVPTLWSGK